MKPQGVLLTIAMFMASIVLLSADADAQTTGACANPDEVLREHVVTGVPYDDPDGGLVMRAGPGTRWQQVGVLAPHEAQVWPTGQCWTSPTGSVWYEVWKGNGFGPAWVSSNFLRPVPQVTPPSLSPPPFLPAPIFVPPGYQAPYSDLPPAPVPGFIFPPIPAPPYNPPIYHPPRYDPPPPRMLPPGWPRHPTNRPGIVVCG